MTRRCHDRAGGALRRLGAAIHAGVLSLALALPEVALAAPEASPPLRVAFTIDTSEVGEEGPVIKRRIDERGAVLLRELEVLPARDDDDPRLIATIRQDPSDPFNYTFAITLVDQSGETRLDARGECPQCTESALTERVLATVRTAIGRLRELERGDEAVPEGPPEPPPVSALEPTPKAGLGTAGKAGLGLTIVGVVGASAGLGLTLNPVRTRPDDPLHTIDTRPPGIGLLAAGGAVLITGVVLLVVDQARRRKRAQERVAPEPGRGVTVRAAAGGPR